MTLVRLAVFSMLLLFSAIPQTAFAHDDTEPLWAMNREELAKLDRSIERHRQDLLSALAQAAALGVSTADLTRPYQYDSEKVVADVPRSVLNRVIMASLNLEVETMRMYLGCEADCERSLFKDLAGHPKQKEAVGLVRSLWPKIRASFVVLFKDIPVGVWMRTIHMSSYIRSINATARYQANAYGTVSMLAGAAAFGTAFTVTEVLETMYAGPLHLICKANYFWSVALGTAVSSVAREFKTLLAFEKEGKSLMSRLAQAFSNFGDLRAAQKIEKRILFQTFVGEDGRETFEKLSKREAHSGVLESFLEKVSAKQAVAADAMLWSELAWALNHKNEIGSSAAEAGQHSKLFDTELDKLFDADSTSVQARQRWQDLASSLRVVLKTFRNSAEVRHQLHRDQIETLRNLGRLDSRLRTFDLFIFSWLKNRDASAEGALRNAQAATWVRNMVSEWLSLAILSTGSASDAKSLAIRLQHFTSILQASVRRGSALDVSPEGFRDLGATLAHEENALRAPTSKAIVTLTKNTPVTCEALFVTSP